MKVIQIRSDSNPSMRYTVRLNNQGKAINCTCPGFTHRGKCKHLARAEIFEEFQDAKNFIIDALTELFFDGKEVQSQIEANILAVQAFYDKFEVTIKAFGGEKAKNSIVSAMRQVIIQARKRGMK